MKEPPYKLAINGLRKELHELVGKIRPRDFKSLVLSVSVLGAEPLVPGSKPLPPTKMSELQFNFDEMFRVCKVLLTHPRNENPSTEVMRMSLQLPQGTRQPPRQLDSTQVTTKPNPPKEEDKHRHYYVSVLKDGKRVTGEQPERASSLKKIPNNPERRNKVSPGLITTPGIVTS